MTSHRLDCLKINLACHEKAGNWTYFDKIVFLLNGVEGEHLRYVKQYIEDHPEGDWDIVDGPRGRGKFISSLENQCVERYPEHLYMKTDEDVFVGKGWAQAMVESYEQYKDNDKLACITALIPNQSIGLHQLLTVCYPEKLDVFKKEFGHEPDPSSHGSTWHSPTIGEWASRAFIDLVKANEEHNAIMDKGDIERWHEFHEAFTVCCVCFHYDHWKNMGGIPELDEPEWCQWIEDNGHINIVDRKNIALHYSYYLQQDWIDRSSVLEDICLHNTDLMPQGKTFANYTAPRLKRVAKQTPRSVKRKLKHLAGIKA